MYYVYILFSVKLNKKYIGQTQDLRERIRHHNRGLDRWTKRGIPWRLIYYEAYLSKKDALNRERFLKSGRGREVIKRQIYFSSILGQGDSAESADLKNMR